MRNNSDHKKLSDAIQTGDTDLVASLLDAQPDFVNHPDWTPPPLHCAVLWNQPAVAQLLVERGADLELLDPDRQTTPLRYAVMFCKPELIPVLLSLGANSGPIVEGGQTALELAKHAANGAFAEFEDLPAPEAYKLVIAALKESGIHE